MTCEIAVFCVLLSARFVAMTIYLMQNKAVVSKYIHELEDWPGGVLFLHPAGTNSSHWWIRLEIRFRINSEFLD